MKVELTRSFLAGKLESADLDNLRHPERLDKIVFEDSEPPEKNFGTWVEDAESWGKAPRRTVLIPDYYELDGDLKEGLESLLASNIDDPYQTGEELALNAINAQKYNSGTTMGAVIGFEIFDESNSMEPNTNQMAGPSQKLVHTPDWIEVDDWYSELDEIVGEGYIGIITSKDTAYARHLRHHAKDLEKDQRSFDPVFWEGYSNVIEQYS